METVNAEVRNADIQIAKDATNEDQAKLLMTMPGVDYYAAMVLLSEIGDVHRFNSDEKLVSWVGLAPQVHQSGETQLDRAHHQERFQESTMDSRPNALNPQDNTTHECESSMNESNGSMDHQKAIVAVARKMLAIMYVMLIRNEPYHGENPQLTEQKHKRLDTLANSA